MSDDQKMMSGGGGSAGSGKQATLTDSSGERDNARKGLIGLNNLNYRLEPDMSVAVNCTDKNHFFQQQNYTNTQRAVCVLNSGADYIDARRSFLNFTCILPVSEAKADTTYGHVTGGAEVKFDGEMPEIISFGRHINSNNSTVINPAHQHSDFAGSALNLIDRITISTRSGDEISRIERANLLSYICEPWKRDNLWRETIGQGMGMNRVFKLVANPTLSEPPYNDTNKTYGKKNNEMRISIPLYCLSPFFNYDKLLPAMLMSGLRIEIQWAAPNTAFCRSIDNSDSMSMLSVSGAAASGVTDVMEQIRMKSVFHTGTIPEFGDVVTSDTGTGIVNAATIPSYTIDDIYFTLKSVQLTDSVQRILNETSAVNGLEIVYTDYQNTQQTFSTVGPVYMEVRHAASRALRAIVATRCQSATALPTSDSLATTGNLFSRWQFRLGSLYFPHQPIKNETAIENINQTYLYTADAMGKVAGAPRCSVGMEQYTSEYEKAILRGGKYAQLLGNATTGQPLTTVEHKTAFDTRYPKNDVDTTRWLTQNRFCSNAPIAVSLERSTLFNLSGIPINNSRVLSFHGTWEKPSDTTTTPAYGVITMDIFLEYVRLARVFLNNVEIEQ